MTTEGSWLYRYKAIVRRVYDGDTITVDIDLGLESWLHGQKLRLWGINTPELRRPTREAGLAARDFLRKLIDGKEIYIQSHRDKRGKYGRYLATVWLPQGDPLALSIDGWVDVNQMLVDTGHAVEYMR